jgi:DNA-binding Lrp family transcriptional regulator
MPLLEKAVAGRMALHFFGNKYLAPHTKPSRFLSYAATRERENIDMTDHRILCALMNFPQSTWRETARRLVMPFSTFEHRMRRLKEKGLIVGSYYHFSPAALGLQSFLLLVCFKGLGHKTKAAFLDYCRLHPDVVLLIEAVGSWDFEVAIDVADTRHTIEIVQGLHEHFGANIVSCKILPSFNYSKVREYPFIETPAELAA